ncbi:class I SAM-dependent methyltransferase [Acinetobacter populi]|jgi:ubiquinone/menaquinone biosynthesis C-methylase UbiE|uniref:SAM-dependent methyltransferase n=1 Tax=Acinetobacter populi TaxID=1582270 RepID=A0A1Z9Z2W7_9GAMM|nr:class I SAM-dependent methyltransferase [Acinetobacter populi]MCH4248017.1 class I SAM-dependent methyltransferase [Acinetobacter populi]OUY08800.1 SAM-dependent methyltransferase [Acinetobacter populi]
MSNLLHPAAQQGFSQGAELYQQSRPNYPNEVVDWLKQELQLNGKSKVVDLGAGTGKFIPYLQQVTPHIFAIEPIAEMLDQLIQKHPDIHNIQTDSKNITLPSNSIDAVICAQSFHWFANAESLDEIYHVLKPHAALGLIWNQRDISFPWIKAITDLITPLEGDTPRFYRGTWQNIFEHQHSFQLQSIKKFQLLHRGSVEQVVVNRILSTSFISAAPVQEKERIRQGLIKIVEQHLNKGLQDTIDFPYVTYAYHYKKC